MAVDREEAGRYKAGITSVGAMIQLVTNGVLLGKYRPDDSEDELECVQFYVSKECKFTDYEPPYEWKMDQKAGYEKSCSTKYLL